MPKTGLYKQGKDFIKGGSVHQAAENIFLGVNISIRALLNMYSMFLSTSHRVKWWNDNRRGSDDGTIKRKRRPRR